MALLRDTAQATMDLYYQQFKADEEFFDFADFKYLNSVAYADLLQQYYDESYKRNLAEKGVGDVDLSDDLFILEQAEVIYKDGVYSLTLKQNPYSFLHDNSYRSIQNIFPAADAKCNIRLARISSLTAPKLKTLPVSQFTFWYRVGGKIIFEKVRCGLGNVTVQYIPSLASLDDGAELADGLQRRIIEATLTIMFAARNGTTVNLTNNQNPNKVMETEIDGKFQQVKR